MKIILNNLQNKKEPPLVTVESLIVGQLISRFEIDHHKDYNMLLN